jgi:hypothetical protein
MWVFNLLERRVHPVDREIGQAGPLAKSLDTGKVVPLHIVLARLTLQALCRDISKGACLDQGSY